MCPLLRRFAPVRSSGGLFCVFAVAVLVVPGALAGPPYLSDDPEPTGYQHYEIYAFANGEVGHDGSGGEAGIDFNYGAAPDLQLTAVLPLGYARPNGDPSVVSLGNIELAAKYRFVHQEDVGWDVSVFPRVFLPAGSGQVGVRHASFFLPVWFERDWGTRWASFGGGGCALNYGGDSRDYCVAGWVITYQLLPKLQLGAEIFHQTADVKGGRATTTLGAGVRYDLSDNYHLLGYIGPTIQNADQTSRYTWYSSILFTF
jgi:hypothetical protein